ncbi:ParB/RepB/Spo0J family partition protein [Ornithinimicrobium flavum]|uniref:ParB/RepB/Spo0J family partition protein n=1 Tax=Ornithinimicrobium flavum TaxID=1288636 RepID=UPI0010705842|nr:ParB/RepB/Spo0J family partition protein [Ornithinimicrobium flavum]
MSERRRGLGRGLGALIPSEPQTQDRPRDVFFPRPASGAGELDGDGFTGNHAPGPGGDDNSEPTGGEGEVPTPDGADLAPVPGATFAEVRIADIRPNPRQPREVFDEDDLAELLHSIRELGVLQPVVVRRVDGVSAGQKGSDRTAPEVADTEPQAATYELVMGERRLRASRLAGRETIPAIVRDTEDDHMLRDALLENLHRAQLNPLEEAAAYQQLLTDFTCTHDELAQRIGRSRPQISNTIRLLKLPPMVQRRVASGVLSAGHARALLGLEDGAAMERLAQRIVAEGLSVRSVEEIVVLGSDPAPTRRSPRSSAPAPELQEVAARLSDRLETRVQVAMGRRKGRITVEFAGQEDLDRILAVLDGAQA